MNQSPEPLFEPSVNRYHFSALPKRCLLRDFCKFLPGASQPATMSARLPDPILTFLVCCFVITSIIIVDCCCKDNGNTVTCSLNSAPCGNASSVDSGSPLCYVPGDEYGFDSICHFTHPQALMTGYYPGGFIGRTFTDPVCSQHCYRSSIFPVFFLPSSAGVEPLNCRKRTDKT